MKFKDFINESYLDAKKWANDNLSGFGKDDAEKARFYKELSAAGFTNGNDAGKAWKSLLVHDEGVFGPAKKGNAASKKPAAKKALSVTDAEIDKVAAMWEAVAKAASAAGQAGRALAVKVEKDINNTGDTRSPEYAAWVSASNLGYQEDIIKLVTDRKNSCRNLKTGLKKIK